MSQSANSSGISNTAVMFVSSGISTRFNLPFSVYATKNHISSCSGGDVFSNINLAEIISPFCSNSTLSIGSTVGVGLCVGIGATLGVDIGINVGVGIGLELPVGSVVGIGLGFYFGSIVGVGFGLSVGSIVGVGLGDCGSSDNDLCG